MRASGGSRPGVAIPKPIGTPGPVFEGCFFGLLMVPGFPPAALATIRLLEGTSQIKREMAKRRIVVGVNVRDRDLGGFVAELQEKVGQQVKLPPGYYFEWGGQFENMTRARRHLMIIVPITIGAIFFLLFL